MNKLQAALRLVGVGFFIGGSIVLGVLAGIWLDSRYNTQPLFVILGLFAGLGLAFYGVYQMLLPLLNNNNKRERRG